MRTTRTEQPRSECVRGAEQGNGPWGAALGVDVEGRSVRQAPAVADATETARWSPNHDLQDLGKPPMTPTAAALHRSPITTGWPPIAARIISLTPSKRSAQAALMFTNVPTLIGIENRSA
ncbi:MAG: hypothetical protein OXJ90_03335, partial [Spirochaetaceae bacterium]|nr:hypothetical protein [Spirochaetaceae bacterium]